MNSQTDREALDIRYTISMGIYCCNAHSSGTSKKPDVYQE
ncbi:hypothetical protein SAMN00120144_3913, partial [Hymenobacter roseosalivarius DSM 11622]